MKFALTLSVLLLTQVSPSLAETTTPPSTATASGIDAESLEAASIPLRTLIRAYETNDPVMVRQAFHPDGIMVGARQGNYHSMPISEWMKNFVGKPSDDEAQRKRSFQIIALTPGTGIARLDLVYPDVTYTDYMSLLKVDGEWKIVQKLYYGKRTLTPSK